MRDDQWIAADWDADDVVFAGCTTRVGGLSSGRYASLNLGAHVGDDSASVAGNRQRVTEGLGLPSEPRWLEQVHGTAAVVDPAQNVEGDAAFTTQRGLVCAVMIADCLPVLLRAEDGSEIAAVHAGWRGLAGGVIENAVQRFSSEPRTLRAWLGPAISQDAFEVGGEVRDAFVAHDAAAAADFEENADGRWQADIYGLARRRLAALGVGNVTGGEFCTYGEPERFFSYRRDGQCGRMAALIFRR